MIGFAFVAQAPRIDFKRTHEFGSARIEIPAIGRHEPGGVEDVTLAQCGDHDRWLAGRVQFQRYRAVADQVEFIGAVVFAEQVFARRKAPISLSAISAKSAATRSVFAGK